MRRRRFGQFLKLVVPRHSDDLDPGLPASIADALTDRILTVEEDTGESFIDDHDWRSARRVPLIKTAASHHRDTQQLVVARPRLVKVDGKILIRWHSAALDRDTHR